jgi:class 3 adenylate cyclase
MTPSLDDPSRPLPRQRCTVLVLDVAESVRLMQHHEDAFIRRWRGFVQAVRARLLPAHGGRLVKSLGDGLLLTFPEPAQGLAAALAAQALMREFDLDATTALPPLRLRAGLHRGEVVADDLDVYGRDVNLAARLAGAARPGEVVVSEALREGIGAGEPVRFEDLGALSLRHLSGPVRAFRATAADAAPRGLTSVPAASPSGARPAPAAAGGSPLLPGWRPAA